MKCRIISVQTMKVMRGFREFLSEGVQAGLPENIPDILFLVINLFYRLQRGSNQLFINGFILDKTILFVGFRWGYNIFQWGGCSNVFQLGGGGVQKLISIETHITCDFKGGPDM